MAWIQLVAPDAATGMLKQLYEAATRRAGKVYQIIQVQSRRPKVLRLTTQLYLEVMHSRESRLTRVQREMLATAVSDANRCHY